MSDIAIRVENLSKQYQIGQLHSRNDTLRDMIVASFSRLRGNGGSRPADKDEKIWALKDVTFEVKRGEVVGIIGRNGAGKSTLLKILSRITEPTSGRAEIYGRVGSLLEVGTGFHPELSGRENIYLSGALLGMRREEIGRLFDEIVDFSGVEKFIDTPVKRYSSGMNVRLGFAVAAHLEPEVLLVDEVLAVGDAAFQKKCLGKMGDISQEGRTILFVSHNLTSISALCENGILIENAQISDSGNITDVITNYLALLEPEKSWSVKDLSHSGSSAFFTGIDIGMPKGGQVYTSIVSGQPLEIKLDYEILEEDTNLDFAIGIYDIYGIKITHLSTLYSPKIISTEDKIAQVVCYIPKLPLPEGQYRINLAMYNNGQRVQNIEGAALFDVVAGDFYGTGKIPPSHFHKFFIEHEWTLPNH